MHYLRCTTEFAAMVFMKSFQSSVRNFVDSLPCSPGSIYVIYEFVGHKDKYFSIRHLAPFFPNAMYYIKMLQ